MEREVIEVYLSSEERSLILRHGCPFARIEDALTSRSKSKNIEIVPLDVLELQRLIGDLSSCINDMESGALQNELLAICERLEAAEQYGDGLFDEF